MVNKIVKNYWENCGENYAHLIETGKRDKKAYYNGYNKLLLNGLNELKLNLEGKIVIDYGCGGGFLGELLLTEYQIKRYIGFDIAERSLERCRNRLSSLVKEGQHFKTLDASEKIKPHNADILFTLAVMQHFQNKEVLDTFLKRLNESDIKHLCLHFRYNEETKFSDEYETKGNIGLCCYTNAGYLSKKLSKYEIKHKSEIGEKSFAQGAIFEIL